VPLQVPQKLQKSIVSFVHQLWRLGKMNDLEDSGA
jgi:hypothetical protein